MDKTSYRNQITFMEMNYKNLSQNRKADVGPIGTTILLFCGGGQ